MIKYYKRAKKGGNILYYRIKQKNNITIRVEYFSLSELKGYFPEDNLKFNEDVWLVSGEFNNIGSFLFKNSKEDKKTETTLEEIEEAVFLELL